MPKYIDCEPLINYFSGVDSIKSISESIADARFVEALKKAPAANVAEVRTAYWKHNQNGTYTCSACGGRASKMNFCGHCGAKMLGEKISLWRYDELVRKGLIESDRLYFITEERKDGAK